ncbi:MAG: CYTH domain-containing protein [Bacteroidota bacterium]
MGIEIERKFLVKSADFKNSARKSYRITQGFLNKDPRRTVRVRLLDVSGKLTVKGMGSEDGLTRFEWETELSFEEAKSLLELCEDGIIDKTRYVIPNGTLFFEVDEFYGDNEGLIISEIELPETETAFEKPHWLGDEVTGDVRYYNSYLSDHPFNSWT